MERARTALQRDRRDSEICAEKVDSDFIIIYIIYNIYNNKLMYKVRQVGDGAKKAVTGVTLVTPWVNPFSRGGQCLQ